MFWYKFYIDFLVYYILDMLLRVRGHAQDHPVGHVGWRGVDNPTLVASILVRERGR